MINGLRLKAQQRLQALRKASYRMAGCERGAVIPLFLVSAGVIFAVTLGGIDLARHASASTRLQNALDGAALAAGQFAMEQPALANNASELLREARLYFRENFPEGYLGTQISPSDVQLKSFGAEQGSLTLEVNSSLRLLITGFLDVGNASLKAESTVSYRGTQSPLEVVFAVDATAHANELASKLEHWVHDRLQQPDNTMALGLVPFSEMVNVGTGSNQRRWVQNWRNQLAEGVPSSRLANVPSHYVNQGWTGCIAEPRPWRPLPRQAEAITPLSPNHDFFPVFVRVNTSFFGNINAEKSNTPEMGDGWELYSRGNQKIAKQSIIPAGETQPRHIEVLGYHTLPRLLFTSSYDFKENNGNPHSSLHVFSFHEPDRCASMEPVRFLEARSYLADPTSQALGNALRNALPSHRVQPIPAAGLMWAWRMLTDAWREGPGWTTEGLISNTGQASRAIVLVTAGRLPQWSDLLGYDVNQKGKKVDGNNGLPAPWLAGEAFDFNMDFFSCRANCATAEPDTHTHHVGTLSAQRNGWQRPVSSIVMKHPLKTPQDEDGKHDPKNAEDYIDLANGPTVAQITAETCKAIKASGVKILVVATSRNTDAVLQQCASDIDGIRQFYTASQFAQLKQALQSGQSEATALRLIR